jgi:hypothetical protein
MVAFFLANTNVLVAQTLTVCKRLPCARWQLTPASAHTLEQLHVSPTVFVLVSLVVGVFSALVWFAIAGVIAWRQSRQWLALLTSLLLITQGVTQMSGSTATPFEFSAPQWRLAFSVIVMLSLILYLLVFSLFPTGRFVPGWAGWAIVLVGPPILVYFSKLSPSPTFESTLNPLFVAFFASVIVGIMGTQIYRFQRVSTQVERQQTKWVILSVSEGVLVGTTYFVLPLLFPALGQPDSLYFVLARPAYNILWLLVPVCFGIAILRYHLWDIDAIINKALVYGLLTGVLAVIFVGVVIGLQAIARTTTGQNSPIALVASTLLIAGLIQPVRSRIQKVIDRHFYRAKYDARKAVEAFNASLRQELSLTDLRERLIGVVKETMQPAHVSLWLAPPDAEEPVTPIPSTPASRTEATS